MRMWILLWSSIMAPSRGRPNHQDHINLWLNSKGSFQCTVVIQKGASHLKRGLSWHKPIQYYCKCLMIMLPVIFFGLVSSHFSSVILCDLVSKCASLFPWFIIPSFSFSLCIQYTTFFCSVLCSFLSMLEVVFPDFIQPVSWVIQLKTVPLIYSSLCTYTNSDTYHVNV